MTPKKPPPFPEEDFVATALVYAAESDLYLLAAQCGASKPGYRLQSLDRNDLAALLAEHAAKHVLARQKALKGFLETFGDDDPGLTPDLELKEIRARVKKLTAPSARKRAAWMAALLLDPREEVWPLVELLRATRKPAKKKSAVNALRQERDEAEAARAEAEKARTKADRARRRLDRELKTATTELDAARADRDRLMEEARKLRRQVSREVELRKTAESRADRAGEKARSQGKKADARKDEVLDLRQRLQVRETGGSRREWKDLWNRLTEGEDRHEALNRDYSALKLKLREYEDRMAEAWSAGKVGTKALRPRQPDEPLVVEAPLETDPRDAEDKVRLPADPHHWPGGHDRFQRFLERIARNPHVTRVVPRTFKRMTQHEISFVTDGGDLVGRISDGNISALILILTTATHRGQGEHIRQELAPLFRERGL